MGFDLLWNEDQIKEAANDFSEKLSKDLEHSLEKKNEQIRWCKSMADLSRRFQDLISFDDLIVAELRFSSMSAEYRALCIVLPEKKSIFYYTTVPKKGSYQEKQLNILRENSEEIRAHFSEKC